MRGLRNLPKLELLAAGQGLHHDDGIQRLRRLRGRPAEMRALRAWLHGVHAIDVTRLTDAEVIEHIARSIDARRVRPTAPTRKPEKYELPSAVESEPPPPPVRVDDPFAFVADVVFDEPPIVEPAMAVDDPLVVDTAIEVEPPPIPSEEEQAREAEEGDEEKDEAEEPPVAPIAKKTWLEIELVDAEGKGVAEAQFAVILPDGRTIEGCTNANGLARIDDVDPGRCQVRFPALDADAWESA